MRVLITPRAAISISDPNVKDCRVLGFTAAVDSNVSSKVPLIDWCTSFACSLWFVPTSMDKWFIGDSRGLLERTGTHLTPPHGNIILPM